MAIENFVSVAYTEGPKLATALEQHVLEYGVDVMNLQRAEKLIPAKREGGLHEVNNIMVRLRELSIQAASDTIGTRERQYLNQEFFALKDEIDALLEEIEQCMSTYRPDSELSRLNARSSTDWPKARKWRQTMRRRCASLHSGKHRRRLTSAMCQRRAASSGRSPPRSC